MVVTSDLPTLACQAVLSRLAGGDLPDWAAFSATVRPVRLDANTALFEQGADHPYVYVVAKG